jgi:hypothetical protein
MCQGVHVIGSATVKVYRGAWRRFGADGLAAMTVAVVPVAQLPVANRTLSSGSKFRVLLDFGVLAVHNLVN